MTGPRTNARHAEPAGASCGAMLPRGQGHRVLLSAITTAFYSPAFTQPQRPLMRERHHERERHAERVGQLSARQPRSLPRKPQGRAADPERQLAIRAQGRRAALRRAYCRTSQAHRHDARRGGEDGRPSSGVCGVARCTREAHGVVVRPLRRATGRAARTVEDATVRAHREGRQVVRARRLRRQRPGVHASFRHRGASCGEQEAAHQPQVGDRRRGRSR